MSVTIYHANDYKGGKVILGIGSYNSVFLKQNNFLNTDNLSSIGSYCCSSTNLQIQMFTGNDFTGKSDMFTGCKPIMAGQYKTNTRSLIISQIEHFSLNQNNNDNNNYLIVLLLIISFLFLKKKTNY